MKTPNDPLDVNDCFRLGKAIDNAFTLPGGLTMDDAKEVALDAIERFFEDLRIERTPYSEKLAYIASMLHTEPDRVRALFSKERIEEAYRRDRIWAKPLNDGDASGAFKGDATASVMKELGLDKLAATP